MLTMTGQQEFDKMTSLNILGLQEPTSETAFDHEVFKEQVTLSGGTYQTSLPWKAGQVELPDNKTLSYGRLASTIRKLEKLNKLEDYNEVMRDQLELAMFEPVPL
jgi:hypothetical protein